MRLGRLVFGIAAMVLALWIIVGEQITGVSSDAVVNARLTTVRSPIAGTISMPFLPFGSRVSKDEELAVVNNDLADQVRLHDLQMELEMLTGRILAATALETETALQMQQLKARENVFRDERIAEIDVRLDRARERLTLLSNDPDNRPQDVVTVISDSGVTVEQPSPTLDISLAREEVETLAIAQAAASKGVFLGDGYNDAPNSQQRFEELRTSIAMTRSELIGDKARLAALRTRIAAEQLSVNKLTSASLKAPSKAILWEVLADDGEVVQRGQDVLRLMKCSSAIVTVSVPDNVYNRLSVGDVAKFRLEGSRTVMDGTITRIAGSGAAAVYDNLAVAPSRKHLERYDVMILVPELRASQDLECTVGRTGRVFFDTRPLDWLRGLGR